MTVFDLAAKTIFADVNMATGMLYRAGGLGAGVAIRGIVHAPDQRITFGEGNFVSDSVVISVKVSDVSAPAAGDTFEVGAVLYEAQGTPQRDAERLVWMIEVTE